MIQATIILRVMSQNQTNVYVHGDAAPVVYGETFNGV